jgi:hypothetical protein
MKNLGNSNVNINNNDNKNSNVDITSLLSELFGNQGDEFPCTIGDLCYEKKNLIKSGAAAVGAKKAEEPTEKAVEKSAAPAAAAPAAVPVVIPAAPAADVNFDQFANFADFQEPIFADSAEFDGSDDDFFA